MDQDRQINLYLGKDSRKGNMTGYRRATREDRMKNKDSRRGNLTEIQDRLNV